MRKQWFEFTKENPSVKVYNSLNKEDKNLIDKYKAKRLVSASEERVSGGIREILRFKAIIEKPFNKIVDEDLDYYLTELKKSGFADYSKNKAKGFVQNFLKWNFKDWSVRFDEFNSIKYNSDAQRKKAITSKDVLSKADIEKLIKAEPSLYWKTFFIIQYEGGLRTGEVRKLKWSDVDFSDDDFCFIKVSSSKNKNATPKFREIPLKEANFYLNELKKEQKQKEIETDWVFPGKNPNYHVSKSVNLRFNALTKRVFGKSINPYLLRHTRGTELKKLIKEGGMSKDNAVDFMGHSERMFDKVYSHMDKEDVKKILKQQLYNFEHMPEEKRHELETEVQNMKKIIESMALAVYGKKKDWSDVVNTLTKSSEEV